VPNQNHWPRDAFDKVVLDEVGVLNCAPRTRRKWGCAETWQIDQMNARTVLKQNGDAAKALAIRTPAVQED